MRTIKRDIVGAFVFSADAKLLLGKTGENGVYLNQWVVPGGGIEPGETKRQAIVRELKEETGILLNGDDFVTLEGQNEGESEKTLRDTKERVVVKMVFWDFKVTLPVVSDDVKIKLDDDLSEAAWFAYDELEDVPLAEATEKRLKKLGLLV